NDWSSRSHGSLYGLVLGSFSLGLLTFLGSFRSTKNTIGSRTCSTSSNAGRLNHTSRSSTQHSTLAELLTHILGPITSLISVLLHCLVLGNASTQTHTTFFNSLR